MSDYKVCTQCGVEIEESGIQLRGKYFCSDECCEKNEEAFLDKDEPVFDELAADDEEEIEITDEDLEYEDDDGDMLDDDYDIKPEDF